jgi:phosphoribosylglycinamide formyltransferase 1
MTKPKPKLMIFASGTKDAGGSGFRKLVEAVEGGTLHAEIVAVVSNHPDGGVKKIADEKNVIFYYFEKPWTAERYQEIAEVFNADFYALSGWLKMVEGLDPETKFNSRTVFNIHPGPLPKFGGDGMYGHYVHEAVVVAFERGEVTHSAVSMHFVTPGYDRGPCFFKRPVVLMPGETAGSLQQRVNVEEHSWQAKITDLVVNGHITWDGVDPKSLKGAVFLDENSTTLH